MNIATELTTQVFEYLNSNVEYAVLRNYEGLPLENPGRDIDILVSRKEFKKRKKKIWDIIDNLGGKIITYYNIERESIICACYDNGAYKLIQFDFLFNIEVKGVVLIKAEDILLKRLFNGKVYHVTHEYEYLSKLLYNNLLSVPFPAKYSNLELLMKENIFVKSEIERLFNMAYSDFLKLDGQKLYLRRLTTSMSSNFILQGFHLLRFVVLKVRHNIKPSVFSIGFTGPDGSGKTTVINQLIEVIEQVSSVHLKHFRPSILSNIGDVANEIGIKKEVDRDYTNPHRAGKVGFFSSLSRLLYYSADYIIGMTFSIKKYMQKTQIVIFDRYYTDVIADSRRSRIFINPKFLFQYGKVFIPSLDYNILLTADSGVILTRKQELTADGIDSINKKLDFLSHKKGYYLINNDGTPSEAVNKILDLVFSQQHKKNLKRLIK